MDRSPGASLGGWLVLLPFVVAVLAFANTLPGDFVFDDALIESDESLSSFRLRRIFAENYWGELRETNLYRPLVLLTYALDFQLGRGAWHFHAVNVLLNALVAVLAFQVLARLLGDRALAVAGACLYAVLPVHCDAVAYVVGRAEILAGAAVLGSWLVALSPGVRTSTRVALVSAITFLGLLAKENAVVIPGVLLGAAWILRRPLPWKESVGAAAAILSNVVLRFLLIDMTAGAPSFVDNPLGHVSAAVRIPNAFALLGTYLAKIVAPIHLAADYSFDQLPVAGLDEPGLWARVAGVAALLAVPAWLLRRRVPLAVTGIVFFLVSFAPTANLLFPIGTIFGERLAYTPSFAYPLVVCALSLYALRSAPALRRPVLAGLGIVCLAYAARTVVRNDDWSRAELMHIQMASDSPRSTRSHLKAAETYLVLAKEALRTGPRGRESAEALLDDAEASIARSLAIDPKHGDALAMRGELQLRRQRFAEAVASLDEAERVLLETRTRLVRLHLLRGEAYLSLNRPDAALRDLSAYLRHSSERSLRPDPAAFNFRGLARAMLGDRSAALSDFDRAIELEDGLPELWNNRGFCRLQLGDTVGALADYRRGLAICRDEGLLYDPRGASVWQFLLRIAQAHEAAGDRAEAERARSEAERIRAAAER